MRISIKTEKNFVCYILIFIFLFFFPKRLNYFIFVDSLRNFYLRYDSLGRSVEPAKHSLCASQVNCLPYPLPDVPGNYYRMDREEGSYPPRDPKGIRP